MLRILKPGILSTIQDLGRPSARAYGVPVGGAMDTAAHRVANYILGNPANAPSLEIGGGHFAAWVEAPVGIAHFGAGATLWMDQQPAPSGRAFGVAAGTLLEARPSGFGNYSYLSVFGGWAAPIIMGSCATCLVAGFGGFEGRALRKGDLLKANTRARAGGPDGGNMDAPTPFRSGRWGVSPWQFLGFPGFRAPDLPSFQNLEGLPTIIRALPGPEWHWWTEGQHALFLRTHFAVTPERNRMGIRLRALQEGSQGIGFQVAMSPRATRPILSSGICIGAVQMPPGGQPIALCADAQTTGGYPRVAQIAAVDLPKIAQVPSGQKILFQMVDLETAETLFFQQEQKLARLSVAFRSFPNA